MTNLKTTTFLSNGRLCLQPAGPKTPIANDRPGGASQRGQGSGDFATPGEVVQANAGPVPDKFLRPILPSKGPAATPTGVNVLDKELLIEEVE